jgi:hypothetical protein
MSNSRQSRWEQRRFISFGVLFSGLALPVTGIGNHLARHSSGPHADVAWVAAHVAIGALFVVLATWHVVLNRHALLRYLRSRMSWPALPIPEAAAALALVALVLALALGT